MNQDFDWLTDLSPLLTAQQSWRDRTYNRPTLAHVWHRPDGPFSIACGAALLAAHIRKFRFSPEFIQRLGRSSDERGRAIFDESFLNFLQRLRLRLNVGMPPEGTLLLPSEPILVAAGELAQVQLLESAFRLLAWQSTDWATSAALPRWHAGDLSELETPRAPQYDFTPGGWQIRALFIGGQAVESILKGEKMPPDASGRKPGDGEGLKIAGEAAGLTQIRRAFDHETPRADVFLTAEQDRAASVSHLEIQFSGAGGLRSVPLTRFQNLYQPVLAKGHPVLGSTRKGYLRQRALHQMAAFREIDLGKYPTGWFAG